MITKCNDMHARSNKYISRTTLFSLLLAALPALVKAQQEKPVVVADTIEKVQVLFGTQTRDQVTGSMASVNTATLRKSHVATIGNTLIGRLTGVAIMQNVNTPGFDDAAGNIYIRGRQTFQNNGYLVLLDGFPLNKFSQISPEEIESVSVLKDAASLAIYGIKAANGAILINTKRGHASEKLNVSFNARYGYQMPTKLPDMANSYDFARLYNEALANDGLPPLYTQKDLDGYKNHTDPYLYPDVNWYKEVLRKGSPIQDYRLTFDGGNNSARYFLMLGFMNNKGIYDHTDQEHNSDILYRQFNFRSNVDVNITKRLSALVSLGGDIEDRKFPPVSTESMWQNMATYAPNLYSVRTPDGHITGTATYPNNIIGDLLDKGYQSRHDRTIQSMLRLNEKLDFITPGLNLFGAVFFNSEFNSRYDKTRSNVYYEPIKTVTSSGADSLYYLPRGTATDLSVSTGSNVENNRVTWQGGLDYNRSFNDHELGVLLMYLQDKYSTMGDQAAFAMDNLAGRITYNYRQKYFAELGFSYSGTENYAPDKRFGFFPALSAGWLIHKENFWHANNTVNYLKLRASAGLLGNDRVPSSLSRFPYEQYWTGNQSGQGYYFGAGQSYVPAIIQLRIANPDITWEKAMKYNVGIDAQMFRNKLSLTAEAFYENRYDILVDMGSVTPSMAGVSSNMFVNKGKVNNYGVEANLMFNDKIGDVHYFAGGLFSFARNKIIENYETPRKEAYGLRKQHPVSQNYGLEAIGYFKDQSDIFSSPVQTFSVVRPGDLKYKDQNGDGVIDVNDEKAIGKASYPEITYSFSGGADWKGFDVDFLFQGTGNRSVNINNYLFQPFVNNANIMNWVAAGHWTPDNQANALFPRLTTQSNANNLRASTFWIRNVNLLRLRNVELGYTIPKDALRRLPMNSLRIYVSGLNLLSWDDLDPNVDSETAGLSYPVMKVYTFGLSVKF